MRWVKEILPPRPRARWLLITIRLSTSSLAGTARTDVAVGTARLASMLATVREAAPRSRISLAARAACPAVATSPFGVAAEPEAGPSGPPGLVPVPGPAPERPPAGVPPAGVPPAGCAAGAAGGRAAPGEAGGAGGGGATAAPGGAVVAGAWAGSGRGAAIAPALWPAGLLAPTGSGR